jgi:hypothetical protein
MFLFPFWDGITERNNRFFEIMFCSSLERAPIQDILHEFAAIGSESG